MPKKLLRIDTNVFQQRLYDEDGQLVHVHYFGWISENTFVSKLQSSFEEEIINREPVDDKQCVNN